MVKIKEVDTRLSTFTVPRFIMSDAASTGNPEFIAAAEAVQNLPTKPDDKTLL
jgi:diazepam-binding inhibitor (GABA receptor modulating acyl-CoA-binding protein)